MRHTLCPALLAALCACSSPEAPPPLPTPPPQVFITVQESTVIGGEVRGRVNVSGCTDITQVQILESNNFLADAQWKKSPTDFSLPASLFVPLYARGGIAANLRLSAKVVCADGRTNTSQPVGVSFFPVASTFSLGDAQVMPDTFIALGGFGGTPVGFIGCVGTNVGTALGKANTQGEVPVYNEQLPFGCGIDTQVGERSPVTGTRWVMQPNVGAYAIDDDLNVTASFEAPVQAMGAAKDGTAIFWSDITGSNTTPIALKAVPNGGASPIAWLSPAGGFVNSTPVVDLGNNVAVLTTWQYDMGTAKGRIVVFKYNYLTGALTNGVGISQGPPVVFEQSFPGGGNEPITPNAALNANGSIVVLPMLSVDVSGTVRTTVLACSTSPVGSQCTNADRQWTGRTFDGVVNTVVPFSAGNIYAAVGPYQAWFLDAQDGHVLNLGEAPLRPSGSLVILGLQPGLGTDFYLLNGPPSGWAVELVATDNPSAGELWRFSKGSGESPTAGLTMGIDDSGQPWLRVGLDQVKPLSNTEYRAARGATPIPEP